MYGCESWTIKKAECRRTDAFELWCWRRLLRVPWTARRSNQSILKVISPEYSLEGLILKLKLQYFGHMMRRADSLEKTLMLGKIEGERRGRQRMRWLDGITNSIDMNLSKLWELEWTGRPGMLQSMGCKESDMTEQLNWAELSYWRNILSPLNFLGPLVKYYLTIYWTIYAWALHSVALVYVSIFSPSMFLFWLL